MAAPPCKPKRGRGEVESVHGVQNFRRLCSSTLSVVLCCRLAVPLGGPGVLQRLRSCRHAQDAALPQLIVTRPDMRSGSQPQQRRMVRLPPTKRFGAGASAAPYRGDFVAMMSSWTAAGLLRGSITCIPMKCIYNRLVCASCLQKP